MSTVYNNDSRALIGLDSTITEDTTSWGLPFILLISF